VTADVSISQLFIAGVLPGALLALIFSVYIALLVAAPPRADPAGRRADEPAREARRIAQT
jgi:TRAP-type C4-dicarboxylate transport system permease large subunit